MYIPELPDGIFFNQKYQFFYILEGLEWGKNYILWPQGVFVSIWCIFWLLVCCSKISGNPVVDVWIKIFCDFCHFFAKMAFFSKTNVMIKFSKKLAVV
jgi:hypothetical protein